MEQPLTSMRKASITSERHTSAAPVDLSTLPAMEAPVLLPPPLEAQTVFRGHSRSSSRTPTRPQFSDDLLGNLSPATTLEALNSMNASGALKASVEAASPTQRAFGIRAAVASKSIDEWIYELGAWPWPSGGGSQGFENPNANTQRTSRLTSSSETETLPVLARDTSVNNYYWGSLLVMDVLQYESRIDEIGADMEALDVEELKSRVLETYIIPRSRPSSSDGPGKSSGLTTTVFGSYNRMDDFAAVVTATVLQALPNLSKLDRLMNIWSIRLSILRETQPLLASMDDVEMALKSGWTTLEKTTPPTAWQHMSEPPRAPSLTREAFEVMHKVLQGKVARVGQKLDYMLDKLEGHRDTIPDAWLERMENIESDYGNWVVKGDQRVREGEWARECVIKQEKASLAAVTEEPRLMPSEPSNGDNSNTTFVPTLPTLRLDQHAPYFVSTTDNIASTGSKSIEELSVSLIPSNETKEKVFESTANSTSPETIQEDSTIIMEMVTANTPSATAETNTSKSASSAEESTLVRNTASAEMPEDARQRTTDNITQQDIAYSVPLASPLATNVTVDGIQGATDAVGAIASAKYVEKQGDLLSVGDMSREGILAEPKSDSTSHALDDVPVHSRTGQKVVSDTPSQFDGPFNATNILLKPSGPDHTETMTAPENLDPKSSLLPKDALSRVIPTSQAKEDNMPTPSTPPAHNTINTAEISHEPLPLRPYTAPTGDMPIIRERTSSKQGKTKLEHPLNAKSTSLSVPTTPETYLLAQSKTASTGTPSVEETKVETPISSWKMPRFGSGLGNGLRRSSLASSQAYESSASGLSDPFGTVAALDDKHHEDVGTFDYSTHFGPALNRNEEHSNPAGYSTRASFGRNADSNASIESRETMSPNVSKRNLDLTSRAQTLGPEHTDSHSRRQSRTSIISGYASSSPSPEIQEAQPAEYFKPILSPARSVKEVRINTAFSSPTEDEFSDRSDSPTLPMPKLTTRGASSVGMSEVMAGKRPEQLELFVSNHDDEFTDSPTLPSHPVFETDSSSDDHDDMPEYTRSPDPQRQPRIMSGIDNGKQFGGGKTALGFILDEEAMEGTPDFYNKPFSYPDSEEASPSIGRVRLHGDKYDYTPPGSPTMPARRATRSLTIPEYDIDSLSPSVPQSPLLDPVLEEAPVLSNVSVTAAPITLNISKTTDTQLQQQISEILSNLPATHITLTNSPNISPLKVKKRNYSHSTNYRSFSSRSATPTPSFTLVPAPPAARTPRLRPMPSNPDIKLYHLSRSTGEAPIKLFVRLVGEHGERVMVRVGGGWADLGEYLKEYATHHSGRASEVTDGKVEIQDLPPRNVSGASINGTFSGGRVSRSGGRSSPMSRPGSSMDNSRPMNGLNVRKTRRSVGEESAYGTPPMKAMATLGILGSSPPSVRSSSAMSWRDDTAYRRDSVSSKAEIELGLAGPKSRKNEISREQLEWVESMKEKVRIASVEKDRRTQAEEFGKLGKVGATKRLFKKKVGGGL